MKVNVYCSHFPALSAVTETATRRIEQALDRFAHRIQTVSLTLDDVNGPRGGEDLHGRCVVVIQGLQPVVLNERCSSVRTVLDKLLKRVCHTVSRRIHRSHARSVRPGTVAAVNGSV